MKTHRFPSVTSKLFVLSPDLANAVRTMGEVAASKHVMELMNLVAAAQKNMSPIFVKLSSLKIYTLPSPAMAELVRQFDQNLFEAATMTVDIDINLPPSLATA